MKDYVRIAKGRMRETFLPLAHPTGHAQVDFGEAIGVIGGVRQKLHVFFMDLPHSDAPFIKAYPAETTDAFLDGHVSAFAFFASRSQTGQAGVPQSILYDNTKLAVARILGDGTRDRKAIFSAISARVGSISDNRLGGWHAYRESKAAVNMLVRNFAIELATRNKHALCIALHPGTVDTNLSKPFQAGVAAEKLFTPDHSAAAMLKELDNATAERTGTLVA